MSQVQVEQKSFEMPPHEGMSIAYFITVADIERSVRFYEKVFGANVLSLGDGKGAGLHPDRQRLDDRQCRRRPDPRQADGRPRVPSDPDAVSSFMNFRVADIQACATTRGGSRGAEFLTEPKDKYGETRCYIRDPDGYIIEVGQSKPEFTYG